MTQFAQFAIVIENEYMNSGDRPVPPAEGARLIVLRHAKSDWTTARDDMHRPLNERGRLNAVAAGDYLREIDIDHVLISPADRTLETWRLLHLNVPHSNDPRLYEASSSSMMLTISSAADRWFRGEDAGTLMVVAHNPGSADLVNSLIDDVPAEFSQDDVHRFPTAAIAVIDLNGSWDQLDSGGHRLTAFHLPR